MRTIFMILASVSVLTAQISFQADLVSYWPMDGNLEDATGRHDGVYKKNPRFDDAVIPLTFTSDAAAGQAIDLRGDGYRQMPYVDPGILFPNDGVRTFCLFVKTDDFNNELVWVGSGAPDKSGSFDNRRYFGVQEQTIFVGAGTLVHRKSASRNYPVRDNAWHHYAIVIGSKVIKVYQDGNALALNPSNDTQISYGGTTQSSTSLSVFGVTRGFIIGMGGGQRNHPANSLLDDIAIFDGELSSSEINAIVTAGSLGAVDTGAVSVLGSTQRVYDGRSRSVSAFTLNGQSLQRSTTNAFELARGLRVLRFTDGPAEVQRSTVR